MAAFLPCVDLRNYLVISVWFGCNNDCILCMLRGLRESLPPIGFDRFREVITEIRDQGRFKTALRNGPARTGKQ